MAYKEFKWIWERERVPVMVQWTIVPFLSSIETVSLFNFIKNLQNKTKQNKNQITTWKTNQEQGKEEERKEENEVDSRSSEKEI